MNGHGKKSNKILGICSYSNGDKYEGELVDGKKQGKGFNLR